MTIKWGDPIECNGVRPDWLRDGERLQWAHSLSASPRWTETLSDELNFATGKPYQISHIRVRDDHPAYVALARGFTPWSGGESAPDDWDGGAVLQRCGYEASPAGVSWVWPWRTDASEDYDIIGYRKRVEYGAVHTDGSRSGGQPPRYAPCDFSEKDLRRAAEERETTSFAQAIERGEAAFIMRRPESDWIEWVDALGGSEASIITALGQLGLIRPETTAERFTRETGHAVTEAVEAALNWKGE